MVSIQISENLITSFASRFHNILQHCTHLHTFWWTSHATTVKAWPSVAKGPQQSANIPKPHPTSPWKSFGGSSQSQQNFLVLSAHLGKFLANVSEFHGSFWVSLWYSICIQFCIGVSERQTLILVHDNYTVQQCAAYDTSACNTVSCTHAAMCTVTFFFTCALCTSVMWLYQRGVWSNLWTPSPSSQVAHLWTLWDLLPWSV